MTNLILKEATGDHYSEKHVLGCRGAWGVWGDFGRGSEFRLGGVRGMSEGRFSRGGST